MNILVTGGAGFVGSHYIRTLLGGGYPGFGHARVTVLDKLTRMANLANLDAVAASPRFSFVRGDIGNPALLASVLAGQDLVVNFAAEMPREGMPGEREGAADLVSANVAGVQVLLQACRDAGVSRVVHVSSYEVYGSIAAGAWPEDAFLAPDSPYAASKASGDLMARAYAHAYGLDVSITRGCHAYGPYQYPAETVPLAITSLLEGEKVPLVGGGRRVRGWVHVDDYCRGVQLVVEKGRPGGIYHIGGNAELSDTELTRALLGCCGADWDAVEYVRGDDGDQPRRSLDDSLLRSMGYAPRIPFDRGIESTVRWYEANRRWWEHLSRPRLGSVTTLTMPAVDAAAPSRRRRGRRARQEPAT